jgi:hypothetical protein
MAFTSYPYVSTNGDRKITAQNEADRLSLVVGSGVVFDNLNSFLCTKSAQQMGIDVAAGSAIIGGRAVFSDATETVTLAGGHATYARIDVITVESNTNTAVRGGRVVVMEGTPAASPAEPAVSYADGVYQIKLMAVTVPPGAATLANATLTDRRIAAAGKHGHAITDITDLANQLAGKSPAGHAHDDRYYTEAEINAALALKSALGHTHDDRYYTEDEVDTKLAIKSDTSHNHDTRYYTESEIDAALALKAAASHTHTTLASLRITGALNANVSAVPNIVFNNTGAPGIDSSMPQGTLYVKYV